MVIRGRAPLRVSFGGGGTDVAPFCEEQGGAIICLLYTSIQEDLQNKEYRPKPVKSYGKSNSGAAWFGLEDSLRASSEPWIRQRIYAKLNGKLKEQE